MDVQERPAWTDGPAWRRPLGLVRSRLRVHSIAGQVFLLQVAVVVLLIAAALSALVLQARSYSTTDAGHRTRTAAIALAGSPGMAKALAGPHPTATLQPIAERTRKIAGFDYVVITDPHGIRYTSPIPGLIGKHIYGPYQRARNGPYTSSFTNPLAHIVDTTAPVRSPGGQIAGYVSVGITVARVNQGVIGQLPVVFGGAAVALCLGMGGAVLVRRRLHRQTHGLGPAGMTHMYEEADRARARLQLLYDAGGRVGTTLDVKRTVQELADVAVPRFADFVTVELADPVLNGDEPSPGTGTAGGPALRRAAVSGVRGDAPLYPMGSVVSFLPTTPEGMGLVTGHPALAADLRQARAWHERDPENSDKVLAYGIHSLLSAPLRARGLNLGIVNFWRAGSSEPFGDDDLSFAEEVVARAGISVDNARRYTREHTMAEELQRSLLPRGLPEQSALDAASRYCPVWQGVGGDWFDVIPLPGFRVALVVGDVVGHGLHAAATMGRLRTAVHNFSTLDLAPDELIARLDDLVTSLDQPGTNDEQATEVTGATCLYAIYDPVSGRCTMARAGHPAPALVRPDGGVDFADLPAGPPLGVSGLPFEAVELQLEAGTGLVLYTNGLIYNRERDVEEGLAALRATLRDATGDSPEGMCDAVFHALVPPRPRDDVALLIGRTRLFASDQVAEWEVPSDPSAVSQIRSECVGQLSDWGLESLAFTTELILSELITNAIRHGSPPVRVRMLRDGGLVCEVSDHSSTSPHLRYAATTDEGGRGLFLVAQLAKRWGTRYTALDKVIWAEQSLTVTPDQLRDALIS
ncbi:MULTISPECIES: SpoIIE family protein phosphatase [unclassified Streptomyces]|uniref:SpoIIE family protein phosphatase n=1 Tax=unclassified Streptomyces TaxID=2593676 RepID=UPI002E29D73B|nr:MULTISPECIES: SpoIIE family protein phosphatase [unclassified Streptomyces]